MIKFFEQQRTDCDLSAAGPNPMIGALEPRQRLGRQTLCKAKPIAVRVTIQASRLLLHRLINRLKKKAPAMGSRG
jgi:hypothetical protein